jgi:putative copper export protein
MQALNRVANWFWSVPNWLTPGKEPGEVFEDTEPGNLNNVFATRVGLLWGVAFLLTTITLFSSLPVVETVDDVAEIVAAAAAVLAIVLYPFTGAASAGSDDESE